MNRSIAQKLRCGEWISAAPVGYLNINKGNRTERGKGEVVLDKQRAPLIRRLFEEYATGLHTLSYMVQRSKDLGLRNSRGNQDYLSLSNIHNMIQNPFYYGVMRVKKTNKEYPHIYPPIISKDLFDQCQRVRLGWSRKQFKWGDRDYIFRGLIKCAATGRMVTSETKKKTYCNGKVDEWTYLRAWNPKNPDKYIYVKEDKILAEVQRIFDSMHLEPEMLEKAIEAIRGASDVEKDHYKEQIKILNSEHTKIVNRLDRLTNLFLDGEFGDDEYKIKRKEFEEKRQEIAKKIENHNDADNNFSERLISILQLASRAGKTFKGSSDEEKRKLVNLVFSNLELKGHKLVYTLRSPFDAFLKVGKTGEWRPLAYSNRTFFENINSLFVQKLAV